METYRGSIEKSYCCIIQVHGSKQSIDIPKKKLLGSVRLIFASIETSRNRCNPRLFFVPLFFCGYLFEIRTSSVLYVGLSVNSDTLIDRSLLTCLSSVVLLYSVAARPQPHRVATRLPLPTTSTALVDFLRFGPLLCVGRLSPFVCPALPLPSSLWCNFSLCRFPTYCTRHAN